MTKPTSPVTIAGDPQAADACAEDALEELRHNRTHTLPPGMRGLWISTKLQRLGEEHLSATDETTTAALGTETTIQKKRRAYVITGFLGGLALALIVYGWLATRRIESPPKDAAVTPVQQTPAPVTAVIPPLVSASATPPQKAQSTTTAAPKPRAKVEVKTQPPISSKVLPRATPPDTSGSDEAIFKSR